MASIIETLAVKLVGDTADFAMKMAKADEDADSFSDKMQAAGGKMMGIGAGLTAGVTLPIVGMGLKAIEAASDLNETMSKTDVVFGKNAAAIKEWASSAATSMGQSKQQALDAASGYGALFNSMGLAPQKSADMSKSLVQLAGDLASFNNLDPTAVLEKLKAGLTGETMPLKSLGVNINAASVEAKALQMGLVSAAVDMDKVNTTTQRLALAQSKAAAAMKKHGADSNEYKSAALAVASAQDAVEKAMAGSKVELTAAQKAQATYALIMEQTSQAQGDFGRTSDGLANSTRIAKAELADATAQLGTQLLPYAQQAVHWVSQLIAKFAGLSPETQKWILIAAGIAAAIGPVITVVGGLVSAIGAISGALAAAGPVLAGAGGALTLLTGPIGLVVLAVAALGAAWTYNLFGIRDKTNAALTAVKGYWEQHKTEVGSIVTDLWGNLKLETQMGVTAMSGIMLAGNQAMNGDWKGAGETLKGTATAMWGQLRGIYRNSLDEIKNLFALFGWKDVGESISKGIAQGVTAGLHWITSAASDAAQSALDAAKGMLGIHSPSTEGHDIGENFTTSMGTGAESGLDRFNEAVMGGMDNMINRLSARQQPMMATAGVGAIHIEQHFYGNADTQTVRSAAQDGVLAGLRQRGMK